MNARVPELRPKARSTDLRRAGRKKTWARLPLDSVDLSAQIGGEGRKSARMRYSGLSGFVAADACQEFSGLHRCLPRQTAASETERVPLFALRSAQRSCSAGPSSGKVIDSDLGESGASSADRAGFARGDTRWMRASRGRRVLPRGHGPECGAADCPDVAKGHACPSVAELGWSASGVLRISMRRTPWIEPVSLAFGLGLTRSLAKRK
jgi:hypothetical protein